MMNRGSGGFPIGGVDPVGGADSRGSYVLKILYDKMKESGPLGGVRQAHPLDPPMHGMLTYLRDQDFTMKEHVQLLCDTGCFHIVLISKQGKVST